MTHFILVTNDMQERCIAYGDVRPYTWWVRAYTTDGGMKPTQVGTHAHGWPMYTIGRPAVVVDEFLKIFTHTTTLTHAWYNLPQRLADIGYTITEWRRCLSYHGLEVEDKKRGREEDVDADEIAPKKKKARAAEPELNPIEKRTWAVGAALGKLALANHPNVDEFLRGDRAALSIEIVTTLSAHDVEAAVGQPVVRVVALPAEAAAHYEIDVAELGMIDVCDFYWRLPEGQDMLFRRALATSIHEKAEAGYAYRTSARLLPGSFFTTRHWPASTMPIVQYEPNTVKSVVFTITYTSSTATKRKGR